MQNDMQTVGIEPYSPWSGYGMAPMLESMRVRISAEDRQSAAATQNAHNWADYGRTRDSWMQNVVSMASRMAEVATASNNSTLNSVDREALEAEFSQLQQGIRGITSGPYASGKFNGFYLFQA